MSERWVAVARAAACGVEGVPAGQSCVHLLMA